MSDSYGFSQAINTWVDVDGSTTNHDPKTEVGFWVKLFHNECDRSHLLEKEIERLREQNELLGKALRQNGITEVRIQPEKWKEIRDDD